MSLQKNRSSDDYGSVQPLAAAGKIQLWGQWFHHSYLHNETPVTTLETEAQWCFLIGGHFGVPGQ